MTREEALKTIDSIDYFGMSSEHKVELSKNFIDKIYDDFESRTCGNCKFRNDYRKCPMAEPETMDIGNFLLQLDK